ncbi:protease Do-like 5, chloroplastic isoform X1 [Iris pallida]|uniref:Protease Do-like 5, chloroplastic isoform X1 n=2 Tax=Iris pallida TaxID=29817 RepID=A0AAX6G904_IRIPA|nr:protease Do-like 5, chloroplastic isoform X1 [Iris pallida]
MVSSLFFSTSCYSASPLASKLSSSSSSSASPLASKLSSSSSSSSSSSISISHRNLHVRRRDALLLLSSSVLASPPLLSASAQEPNSDPQQEEERVVHIFQEASPCVVFIKDLELQPKGGGRSKKSPLAAKTVISQVIEQDEDEEWIDAKVEGTGSGFIWDKAGHIVTNYHVIDKLATDQTSMQRCKVYLQDLNGNTFSKEGKLIGYDPSYDLAILKVDVEGDKLRPALIGTSHDLRVGQSCFAIGNPYGYEHTLTTGVVSGLGREIPSPNGRPIRGAIQTDAAINSGNSGGPLIDSHGHVIGINTATFTKKGTGISSGVNFAIPIDVVLRTVPNLIVYGTSVSNRF